MTSTFFSYFDALRSATFIVAVATMPALPVHAASVSVALDTVSANALVAEAVAAADAHMPCADSAPTRRAWFGDTHVHTRYSLDASTQDTRTTPAQAYAFARGERLGIQPWREDGNASRELQLDRPLDFAVVTDHAELLGEVAICNTPGMEGYSSWQCLMYRRFERAAFFIMNYLSSNGRHMGFCGDNGELCRQASLGPWQDIQRAAEEHYDRSDNCRFTTFVGYEWTGADTDYAERGIKVANLHRNVIFRGAEVPPLPISFIDTPSPQLLWDALDRECVNAGKACDVVVIPHNSNLSDGRMFRLADDNGKPWPADVLKQQSRFETLVEVMQHKGASECYFGAGTTDELCAFEQLPYDTFSSQFTGGGRATPQAGFVREVMLQGLRALQAGGVNPFQWGFVAATDTHLGTPGAVDERDFPGHGGAGAPAEEGRPGFVDNLEYNPGGLSVLYAEENTRESLFAAMRRKEAYGTSGPRIGLRFFGGWDYPAETCDQPEPAALGYQGGVPMGGVLEPAAGAAPRFIVAASSDPGTARNPGAPLQRLQVIKGWIDAKGQAQERVYEVAGDAGNGAAVDLRSCARSGEGFAQLCTVWQDPDFEAAQPAYYYARAVENPSCRWSQYVCAANRVDCGNPDSIPSGLEACCAPEHQPVIQERAWSSPIWYQPGGV